MKRILVLAVITVAVVFALLLGFFGVSTWVERKKPPAPPAPKGPIYELETPLMSNDYIRAVQAGPASDLAVLPIIMHHGNDYSFDICLRRGFDQVATALADVYSTAAMPLPEAISQVKDIYYRPENRKKQPTFGEDEEAVELLNQSCSALNVNRLYFAELFMDIDATKIVIRDYDCSAKAAGGFEKTLSQKGMSPSIMEDLQMESARELAKEIAKRHPGKRKFSLKKGNSRLTDKDAMQRGQELLLKSDPFSLIRAIDSFSAAAVSNPSDPKAWAGLSEAWSSMGFEFREVAGLADRYNLPAFCASRIALIYGPQDPDANRAAAWIDYVTNREYRAEKEVKLAEKMGREKVRAKAIYLWWVSHSRLRELDEEQSDDYFVHKLALATLKDKDSWEKFKELYELEPLQSLWVNTKLSGKFYAKSDFVSGMNFFLAAVDGTSKFGMAAMDDMERQWEQGAVPIAPDMERAPVKKAFSKANADSRGNANILGMKRGTYYASLRDFRKREDEWRKLVQKDTERLRERPLPGLNAGPMLLVDYLNAITYLNIDGHLGMVKAINWPEQWEKILVEQYELYPEMAEPQADAGRYLMAFKKFEEAKRLMFKRTRRFEDNTELLKAIVYYAEKTLDPKAGPQMARISRRWPYDYSLNKRVAPYAFQRKGWSPYQDSIDAMLFARPDSSVAKSYKARVLRQAGKHEEADKLEGSVIVKAAPETPVMIDDSIGRLEEAIKKDPGNKKYYSKLRDLYMEKGQVEKALKVMRRELEVDESPLCRTVTLVSIGNIHLGEGNKFKAMDYYQKASKISYWQGGAIVGLAKGYNAVGDYAKSDAEFARAVERYPNGKWIYGDWGETLMERGELDRASEKFEKAFEMSPSMSSLNRIFEARVRGQKENDFIQATPPKKHKDYDRYYLSLVCLWDLYGKGDAVSATKALEKFGKEEKQSSIDDALRADVALFGHDYEEALIILEDIPEKNKFILEQQIITYLTIRAQFEAGKKKQAVESAEILYRSHYKPCYDQMIAALVSVKSKNVKDARKHFDLLSRSLDLPEGFQGEILLGELGMEFMGMTKSSDHKVVLALFERMKRRSDFKWIWDYYLGGCHEIMKNKKSAVRHYRMAVEAAPGYKRAIERLDEYPAPF